MQKYLFPAIAMLLLAACGDLFNKKQADRDVVFSEAAGCELDLDNFGKIFEKIIENDLTCLRAKLDQFIQSVETDKPGYISKEVLKTFLREGPVGDVDRDIVDIIDSVFDLSYIILGSDKNYIKRSEMRELLDFLTYFNAHVWKVYGYLSDEGELNFKTFSERRRVIEENITLISSRLKALHSSSRKGVESIDLEQLVYNFFKNDPVNLERIRSLMFLKRVFLGGDNWVLKPVEFEKAIEALTDVIVMTFDVVKIPNVSFTQNGNRFVNIYSNDMLRLKSLIAFDDNSAEPVFDVYQALGAVDNMSPELLGDGINMIDFPKELRILRDIFARDGVESEGFSGIAIHKILDHAHNILKEAKLFYEVYDFYAEELNSEKPVTHDFSDFPVVNSEEEASLKKFSQIANNYKFMKGDFDLPFYINGYRRNANAFFETRALEYVIENIMDKYEGTNEDARGGYALDLEQTRRVVIDFKWLLKALGIANPGKKQGGELQGVANNFVLLSTLFQNQSDGCGDEVCMEVPEVTEFAIGLLTAINVKDDFIDLMQIACSTELDQFGRIHPDCFRRNFMAVIDGKVKDISRPEGDQWVEAKVRLADHMPLLYSFLQNTIKDLDENTPITESIEYMNFMRETEGFTRACIVYDRVESDGTGNGEPTEEEVYLRPNDAFAVFAGLLNVESTLIRFDLDENNQLDYRNEDGVNEVLEAYEIVYRPAVEGLVGDIGGSFLKKFSKPIFQYMIKYGKVPDTDSFRSIWKFVRFLLKFNKNADASRTTVASLLKVISEQNGDPENFFQCTKCLKDPTSGACEPGPQDIYWGEELPCSEKPEQDVCQKNY